MRARANAVLHLAVLCCAAAFARATEAGEEDLPARDPRKVDDKEIVTAAKFAMDELKKLSDSGVYETLSLHSIDSAATQTGVFHFNYFLKLTMASPHFKDGKPTASFDVMVMRNLEDGVFSFAIDEFPVMDDDAIEEFWIRKVERHRKERDEAFKQLEREALEEEEAAEAGKDKDEL